MSVNRFRIAASALIAFNLIGTAVTWSAHLSKAGTSNAHAILQGTEFTGPLFLIALWIVSVVMTGASGRSATVGAWLMTLFAGVYTVGEVSELFKKNIGVSAAKWHTIIALDVVGLAIGVVALATGVLAIRAAHRDRGQLPQSVARPA